MIIKVKNSEASVSVDLNGGAITEFRLKDIDVNPISFKFSKDQMPANNKSGAVYQGHFACIGRWGPPSDGEIKTGQPNHGQSAVSLWEEAEHTDTTIKMKVHTSLEALDTFRTLTISSDAAAFEVTEVIKNVSNTGRLYNVVQHPTLAAPFLNKDTRVDSNATSGLNYNFDTNPLQYACEWPKGLCEDGRVIDLNVPDIVHNSVFSFVVDKQAAHGWITAWSPVHSLLIGYVWKRADHPWIDVWQQFGEGELKFRGIEFGTSGVHKSFKEIMAHNNTRLLGENTVSYLDAGEEVSRSYGAFLLKTGSGFTGVESITVQNGNLSIKPKQGEAIELKTGFKTI
ncbi:MAG: hypothetical protein ABIN95_01930 [Mucilaginibacter sp.]